MPDLDGFIKLTDARLKAATAEADTAGKMADVATKVLNLDSIREDIIRKRLENVAQSLDIQWDAQAHATLLRARNLALQRQRQLERERTRLQVHIRRLPRLLMGAGSWTTIRDAWVSFTFVWQDSSIAAVTAAGSVVVSDEAYLAASWRHPNGVAIEPLPAGERFLGALWDWARRHTYYPTSGGAAWAALAIVLQSLSDSADAEATKLDTDMEAVHKEAIDLSKLDWDRLKQP
jgi:hypothetical protein